MAKMSKADENALEILRELHKAGGTDAADDFSKGWDEGISEAIRIVEKVTRMSVDDAIWQEEKRSRIKTG